MGVKMPGLAVAKNPKITNYGRGRAVSVRPHEKCTLDHTPNAETMAAIQESDDMLSGKIPCKWFDSPEALWNALK
jgi:hypothetical protein